MKKILLINKQYCLVIFTSALLILKIQPVSGAQDTSTDSEITVGSPACSCLKSLTALDNSETTVDSAEVVSLKRKADLEAGSEKIANSEPAIISFGAKAGVENLNSAGNNTLKPQELDNSKQIDPNTEQVIVIEIQEGKFIPGYIKLHNKSKTRLVIKNLDSIPAEFESANLNREKIVPAKSEIKVMLPALKPGKYEFMNDFNQDATGVIEVVNFEDFIKE